MSTSDAVEKKSELSPIAAKTIKIKPYASRQKSPAKTKAEPGKVKGYIDKGLQFLREVKIELKKVVWPTRTETTQTALAVLVIVLILGIIVWLLDMMILWAVRLLTGQGG